VNIAFKYSDKDVLIMTAGLLGETASEVGACPVPAWDGSEGKGREGSIEISIWNRKGGIVKPGRGEGGFSDSCSGESRLGIGRASGTESLTYSVKVTEGNSRVERGVLTHKFGSKMGDRTETSSTNGAQESRQGGTAETAIDVRNEGGIRNVADGEESRMGRDGM
jgi:hypothetical protein